MGMTRQAIEQLVYEDAAMASQWGPGNIGGAKCDYVLPRGCQYIIATITNNSSTWTSDISSFSLRFSSRNLIGKDDEHVIFNILVKHQKILYFIKIKDLERVLVNE